MTSTSIAKQLLKSGRCICPDFLSLTQLTKTRNDLNHVRDAGGFKRAGVGHGADTENSVRRDEIYWLNRELANTAQGLLWRKVDALKQAFNRNLFLGLTSFEGHYAVYPQGGFYRRHLDRFQDHGDRIISFILYLNRDWQKQDGGRLRIYDDLGSTDVDPLGGTMVCFFKWRLGA